MDNKPEIKDDKFFFYDSPSSQPESPDVDNKPDIKDDGPHSYVDTFFAENRSDPDASLSYTDDHEPESTKWEAFSSSYQLGVLGNKFSGGLITALRRRHYQFYGGPEAAEQYDKRHKEYIEGLKDDIDHLPKNESAWYINGWGPRVLAGLTDPVTLGAAVATEGIGFAAFPALGALGERVALNYGAKGLAKNVIEKAVHGAVAGSMSGAVLESGEYAYDKYKGINVTYSDVLKNTAAWGGFGLLGGAVGGLIFKGGKIESSPIEEEIQPQKHSVDVSVEKNVIQQQSFSSSLNVSDTQFKASSTIDGTISAIPSINNSIDSLERKQKIYESLPKDVIEKQNIRSPYEQLQDDIDSFSNAKKEFHGVLKTEIESVKKNLSGKDISKKLGSVSLTKLSVFMKDLERLKDISESDLKPSIKSVYDTLKSELYSIGPASKLKSHLRTHESLLRQEDINHIEKMSEPKEELNQLNNYKNARISEANKQKIAKRIESLKNPHENKEETQSLHDSIEKINRAASNFDLANDGYEISKNINAILRGDKYEFNGVPRSVAEKLNNPDNAMDRPANSSMSLQREAVDDRPYAEPLNELKDLDNRIKSLQEKEMLTKEDMKVIEDVDEELDHDQGVNDILNKVSSCLA